MADLQRKKAVSDMERRKKEEEEKLIVSPGLNPAGVQGQITRQQFNEFQAQKQRENIATQNEQIQRQKVTSEIAAKILTPEVQPAQMPQNPQKPVQQDTEIPSTFELAKRALPSIAANTISKTAIGAGGGAVTGGVIGSVVPAAGTAIGAGGGAIVGGIGGFVTGLSSAYNELKKEAAVEVSVEYKDFSTSKTNIKTTLRSAKLDPVGAYEVYQAQWAGIDEAERKFKAYAEKDWLFKARPELEAILKFRELKPVYDQLLLKAMGGQDIVIPEEIS